MSDKDVNIQEKVYTKTEHDGLIKDLQNERDRYHQAQYESDTSKSQIEKLTKTVEELTSKINDKAEPIADKLKFEGEDEDGAKVKDVKAGFKSFEKEAMNVFKKAQQVAKEAEKQERDMEKFHASCGDAITKYSRLKDVGLDFDTVYKVAIRLVGRNKYEEQALIHSTNPGEAIYKKGCEDPDIKAKLDLEENQELLKNMDTRKVDLTGLTGGTKIKNDEFFTPQEVKNMTPAEAVKVLPKIEKSMEYWEELRKGTK